MARPRYPNETSADLIDQARAFRAAAEYESCPPKRRAVLRRMATMREREMVERFEARERLARSLHN
jgi:ribonuclease D